MNQSLIHRTHPPISDRLWKNSGTNSDSLVKKRESQQQQLENKTEGKRTEHSF